MGSLTFNGVSTTGLGIVIQSPPVYEFPEKDREVLHVEGLSGDILIDKGSYKNVKRTYYLAAVGNPVGAKINFAAKASQIASWLHSANGYARLEDSYESSYFRLAHFRNSGELMNMYDLATAIAVTFECKPQRYLKSGEDVFEILPESLDTMVLLPDNLTEFTAYPEILIDGLSLKLEFFHGIDLEHAVLTSSLVTSFVSDRGVIDSDLQECYSIDQSGNPIAYINDKIVLVNGLPALYSGKNWIKVTLNDSENGSLIKISIKPRWWTL